MYRMLLVWTALLVALGGHAQSLEAWMAEKIEERCNAYESDSESKRILLEAISGPAQGFRVPEISECHLGQLDALIDQAARLAVAHSPNSEDNRRDLLRFDFVRNIVYILHSPSYSASDLDLLSEQLDRLSDAMAAGVADLYPEFLGEDTEKNLREAWSSRFQEIAENCLDPCIKQPLPEEGFESLMDAVRAEPLEPTATRWMDEARRQMAGELTDSQAAAREGFEVTLRHPRLEREQRQVLERMRDSIGEQKGPEDFADRLASSGSRTISRSIRLAWCKASNASSLLGGNEEEILAAYERFGVGDDAFEAIANR